MSLVAPAPALSPCVGLSPLPSPALPPHPLGHSRAQASNSASDARGAIPHLSYPHVLACILAYCDAPTLLAFRATSSYFRTWIDGALARHLVFCRRNAAAGKQGLRVTSAGERGRIAGAAFFHACAPQKADDAPLVRVPCRPSLAALGQHERRRGSASGPDLAARPDTQREPGSTGAVRKEDKEGREAEGKVCPSDTWRGRKRKLPLPRSADPLAYVRATAARCRVLDLVGGVPCGSLLPLLSALGSVHTVRLREGPRQYAYSEIGARRRVTFCYAGGCGGGGGGGVMGGGGGLYAPVVAVQDCLRGTLHQVLCVQYDPRHPHLPRLTVRPFALGARLRTLTFVFRPTRAPVPGTAYKPATRPGLFAQLLGPALACITQRVALRIVGLDEMAPAVFGLERGEDSEAAFRGAIAEAWADAHPHVPREEAVAQGWEHAHGVVIQTAQQYRALIGETEWAIEAEEESPALAPRF